MSKTKRKKKRKKYLGQNLGLPNHPVIGTTHIYRSYNDRDDEDFDRGEEFLVLGLGLLVWGVYWGIINVIDRFTFELMPWYVEPFTAFPLVGVLAMIELYGKNPLHWWPLVWGTKIKMKHWHDDPMVKLQNSVHHLIDVDEMIQKLGGPINVHQVDPDTLKFRRKKDITIYLLFTK